nr:permease [Streptomyces lushanensis]
MSEIGRALSIAGSMAWEITWALILGFALSAVVQAVVRRSTVVRLLGDDRPRTLAVAAGPGVASSSCSHAAVALARSLFRKGANCPAGVKARPASRSARREGPGPRESSADTKAQPARWPPKSL